MYQNNVKFCKNIQKYMTKENNTQLYDLIRHKFPIIWQNTYFFVPTLFANMSYKPNVASFTVKFLNVVSVVCSFSF